MRSFWGSEIKKRMNTGCRIYARLLDKGFLCIFELFRFCKFHNYVFSDLILLLPLSYSIVSFNLKLWKKLFCLNSFYLFFKAIKISSAVYFYHLSKLSFQKTNFWIALSINKYSKIINQINAFSTVHIRRFVNPNSFAGSSFENLFIFGKLGLIWLNFKCLGMKILISPKLL